MGACVDPFFTPTPLETPIATPTFSPSDVLWIGDYSGMPGEQIFVDVMISNATTGIDAFVFDVLYDSEMLAYSDCVLSSLDPGWLMFLGNEITPGKVRVGSYSLMVEVPPGSTGGLATLIFDVTCEGCIDGRTTELFPCRMFDDLHGFSRNAGTFTFVAPPSPTATPIPCIRDGDVDLNGQHSAGDAQLAFTIALGYYSPTHEQQCAADCNGDDDITAGDAQAIFFAAVGMGSCTDPLSGGE